MSTHIFCTFTFSTSTCPASGNTYNCIKFVTIQKCLNFRLDLKKAACYHIITFYKVQWNASLHQTHSSQSH